MSTIKNTMYDLGCMNSLKKLPPNITVKFMEMMTKYMTDPTRDGLNLESVQGSVDKQVKSLRLDQSYRAIAFEFENNIMFVHVNEHDKAYRWAKGRRVKLDHATNRVRIVEVEEVKEQQVVRDQTTPSLFENISDKRLLRLGVTQDELARVRGYSSIEALEADEDELDSLTFSVAYGLAAGYTDEEVYGMVGVDEANAKESETTDVTADNTDEFAALVQTPESQQTIFSPKDTQQLKQFFEGELDGWRVWLHPDQRKFAYRDWNGPAMVRGGAGTGKTVVAMHRAKYLADKLSDDEVTGQRILVTTFTTSLANDIQQNLRTLCPEHLSGENPRIEVINLDRWVHQYLKKKNYAREIAYFGSSAKKLKSIWDDVLTEMPAPAGLSDEFVKAEWAQIVQAKGITDKRTYGKVSRAGRGTPLNREKRYALWNIFERYRAELIAEGIAEPDDAYREAIELLSAEAGGLGYAGVIVDEAQDMGEQAFKLIRAIVPETSEGDQNSLFLVGDAHQRIYGRRASMSACGINIVGRSRRLRLNYRTTHQIREWAVSILEGVAVDDLDDGIDTLKGYISAHQGPAPELIGYKSEADELNGLVAWVQGLKETQKDTGLELADIGVLVPSNEAAKRVLETLEHANVQSYQLKAGDTDNRGKSGVRVCTMHRAKGLEFSAVALPMVSNQNFPPDWVLKASVDEADREDKLHEFRSLLHVAATRAKGLLRVTWSGTPSALIEKT